MKTIILTILTILIFSCSGHTQPPDFSKYKKAEFLTWCYEYAYLVHYKYDIHPAVTMAVCILETGYGESYAARVRCNYFGVKKGKKVYLNPYASFNDFGYILRAFKRYKPLWANDTNDLEAFCIGLRECGYNSSEDYPARLLKIISMYELDKL